MRPPTRPRHALFTKRCAKGRARSTATVRWADVAAGLHHRRRHVSDLRGL